MIIKILPIKTKAKLGRIIKYIANDKDRIEDYKEVAIYHNLINYELGKIQKEFEHNYDAFARLRSNGNMALHIIQSFSPLDSDKLNSDIMMGMADALLGHSYKNALAFGVQHSKDNHRHNHFVVSGNEFMSDISTRLSRQELYSLQSNMLEYLRDNYPDLKISYNISDWGNKLNNEREYYQIKRNPNIKLSKEALKEKVQKLFRESESSQEFYSKLRQTGLNTYEYKNSTFGINYGEDGKRIRFSRLGIEREQIHLLDRQYTRLQELSSKVSTDRIRSLSYRKVNFPSHDISHS